VLVAAPLARRLSAEPPQSIDWRYGGEKSGQNSRMGHRILTPNESVLTFRASHFSAKFIKIEQKLRP